MTPKAAIAVDSVPDVPDFLGTASRVQSVADLIQNAQGQLQHLRGLMLVNGQAETDSIPTVDEDNAVTYGERMKALEAGVSKLAEDNHDIAEELVAEAVRRRKALERSIDKAGE